jgi:threonine/homoserine/homoserine lactone efflux protein
MTIELAAILPYALALFVAAASPGPNVAAIVSCGIVRGLHPASALALGVVAGDVFWVGLVVTGLALLAKELGPVFLAVKIGGAFYLAWLGLKLWRASAEAPPLVPPPIGGRGLARQFLLGFGLTLANPKAILFHAGIMPTLLDLERATLTDALVLALVVTVTVGAVHLSYARLSAKARLFLGDPRRLRVVNRIAGTVMIGTGALVLLR